MGKKKKKSKGEKFPEKQAIVKTIASFFLGKRNFPTLPFDGITWNYEPGDSRVLAIGDIHGDLEALVLILKQAKLIDDEGTWAGENSHLVLVGDLIGGNNDSRLLLNFVMRLEKEAKEKGGQVHGLLGNHDLLPVQGNFKKFSKEELKKFYETPVLGAKDRSPESAFRGDSVYAKWIRSRNAILKIGKHIFVHAGLDIWALDSDPGRINATIRAWISHWQGVGIEPPLDTRWTVGKPGMRRGSRFETGPLWIRSFHVKAHKGKKSEDAPSIELLNQILEKYQSERIVVGHSPVPAAKVVVDHPYYGKRVVMLDTRVSDSDLGQLSAIELAGEEIVEIYVDRSKDAKSIRNAEKGKVKSLTQTPASIRGLLQKILKKCGF